MAELSDFYIERGGQKIYKLKVPTSGKYVKSYSIESDEDALRRTGKQQNLNQNVKNVLGLGNINVKGMF